MLLEEINIESIKECSNPSIYSFKLRLSQISNRYKDLVKSDPLVSIDWDKLDEIHEVLDIELESRGLLKGKPFVKGDSISKEYKSVVKSREPLPKEWYKDYREGDGFAQVHVMGITDKEKLDYENNQRSLDEILIGKSCHIDFRIDFGLPQMIQYIFSDGSVTDLIKTLNGKKTLTRYGKPAQCHSSVVIQSSSIEKQTFTSIIPLFDIESAITVSNLYNVNDSYFIEKGNIGASSNRNAFMGLIWKGKIKTGTLRDDLKELFLYPEDNGKLMNGRMIIKQLSDGKVNRWEVWMATTDDKPMDSRLHKDTGNYFIG